MKPHPEWTPADWFEKAAHAYVEGHQACAWCGGSYVVYRFQRGSRLEYYCSECEFYAGHDRQADHYFSAPGQAVAS